MTTSNTQSGWYPDPDGSGGQRFWDGAGWTDHRVPAPAPPVDPPVASRHAAPPEPEAATEPASEPELATISAPIWQSPPPSYPGPAFESEPPRDARSKLIMQYGIGVGVGLVLVIATAVWAATASPNSNDITLSSPATTTGSTAPTTTTEKTTSSESPTETALPAGSPEQGVTPDISFLITAVDSATTITSPDNEYLTKDAQGEFIIVTMDVTDTGTETANYSASLQKLLSGGTAFEPDLEASYYLGSAFEQLAPGDQITATIVYDVPPGTVPDGIELHGDGIGPGITVPFQ
jgi:Domain of unknown function (DUF4352)/Protein of unknown function (DUF2510)